MNALGRGEQLGNNILAFILHASKELASGDLDMEEMVDEFTTFFTAGKLKYKLMKFNVFKLFTKMFCKVILGG